MKTQIISKWAALMAAFLILATSQAQDPYWEGAAGSEGDGYRTLWDMSTDDDGNIYYTGEYRASGFDFGGASIVAPICVISDGYIIKTDGEANTIWSKRFGGVGSTGAIFTSIAPSSTSEVYVSGYYLNFTGASLMLDDVTIPSTGFVTNFIVKLDADGTALWAVTIDDPEGAFPNNRIMNVEVDANDDIVINGFFGPSLQCGDIHLIGHTENADSFVAKLNANGEFLWANGVGANDFDNTAGLAVNDQNEVFCSGAWANDTLWAGDAFLVNENSSVADNFDRWIAKYTADGTLLWLSREGGLDNEHGAFLAADADGGVMAVSRAMNAINVNGIEFENVAALVTKYNFEGGIGGAYAVAEADQMLDNTPLISEVYPSKIIANGDGSFTVSVTYASANLTAGDITIPNTGNAGTTDLAVVNFDADGEIAWALGAGGMDFDYAVSLASFTNGNNGVVVGGDYKSFEMEIGNSELQNNGSPEPAFYVAGIDFTTSILEAEPLETVAIFPNPASEMVKIDLTGKTDKPTIMRVFDARGKQVYAKNVTGVHTHILDLAKFDNGVYFIEVKNNAHRLGGKFIVNK